MARGVGTALHSGDERLLAHRPSSSKAKTGIRVRMDSRVAVPRQHVGRTVMSHELPTAGGRNASQPTGSTTRGSVVRGRSKARWGLQEQTALRWRRLCAKKRVQRLDPRMGGGRLPPKLPDWCVRSGLLAPTVHPNLAEHGLRRFVEPAHHSCPPIVVSACTREAMRPDIRSRPRRIDHAGQGRQATAGKKASDGRMTFGHPSGDLRNGS